MVHPLQIAYEILEVFNVCVLVWNTINMFYCVLIVQPIFKITECVIQIKILFLILLCTTQTLLFLFLVQRLMQEYLSQDQCSFSVGKHLFNYLILSGKFEQATAFLEVTVTYS